MDVVGADVAGQFDVAIDRVVGEETQVAPRHPFGELRDLRRAQVSGAAVDEGAQPRLLVVDHFVGVLEGQMIVGVDIEPPEQVLAPRRQRLRVDRLDVDECEQA